MDIAAMKKVILLVSFVIPVLLINAQTVGKSTATEKDFAFSYGLELAYPLEILHKGHIMGVGAYGQSDYILSEAASLTSGAGIIFFPGKQITATDSSGQTYKTRQKSYFAGTLMGGLKFYLTDNKIYGHSQVGVSIDNSGILAALFTVRVGIERKKIDWSLGFQSASRSGGNFSFLGIKAGYRIP